MDTQAPINTTLSPSAYAPPEPYIFGMPFSYLFIDAKMYLATLALSASNKPINISAERLVLAHELVEDLLKSYVFDLRLVPMSPAATSDSVPITDSNSHTLRGYTSLYYWSPRKTATESIINKVDTLVWLEAHYVFPRRHIHLPSFAERDEDKKYRDALIAPYIEFAEETGRIVLARLTSGRSPHRWSGPTDGLGREIEPARQKMIRKIQAVKARSAPAPYIFEQLPVGVDGF